MSYYDKSSLVLIPSGTNTGKVFSQKPVSGDGDFTFTRASAATRVNADGNIEKETQNLITQSNNFSHSDWTNSGTTLTSGQAGPFGSNNAWRYLMTGGIGSSYSYQNNRTINGSPMVLSFWVKSNTGSNQTFQATANSGGQASPVFTATTSWQRFSWFFVSNAGGGNILLAYNQSTNVDLLIYGAQLEQSLVARDYIETTTAAVYGGITDNTPRLDYTDSSCPALLLEPLSTNLESYSEYLDAAAVKLNTIVTSNVTTSPEGVANASSVVDDATSNSHYFYSPHSTTSASGTTITHSIFAKANGHSWFQLTSGSNTNDQWANFDLTNGVIGNSSASANADMQPMGNGWYRCIINSSTTTTNASVSSIIILTNNVDITSRNTSYVGDGNGVYLYGLQTELASYATSYIPTYGSSVTRVAETCGDAGTSATFNSTEGVLYAEVAAFSTIGSAGLVSLSDGTTSNRITIELDGVNIKVRFVVGGSSIGIFNYATTITETSKIAAKYKANDFALWVNGTEQVAITSGSSFSSNTLNELSFDRGDGNEVFNGKTKQVIVFPTALSDADLEILTGTYYESYSAMAAALNYTVYE